MEDILRKALSEALTDKYAGELLGAEDNEHVFSDDFEYNMKKLIRDTDHPIRRYTKYIAIAACACVAVGCTVLIPLLTGNKVSVDNAAVSESAAAAETTSAETYSADDAEKFETTAAAAAGTEAMGDSASEEAMTEAEAPAYEEEAGAVPSETGAGINSVTPDDAVNDADKNFAFDEAEETAECGGADEDYVYEEGYDYGETLVKVEEDDDDETVDAEDDEDCDDIGFEDEDDCAPDSDLSYDYSEIVVSEKFDTLDEYFSYVCGEEDLEKQCSIKDLKIKDPSYYYCDNGTVEFETSRHEYEFLNEFRSVLAAAESCNEKISASEEKCLTLSFADAGSIFRHTNFNTSDWLNYDAAIGGNGDYAEDVYEEEIEDGGENRNISFNVDIYENGRVCVSEIRVSGMYASENGEEQFGVREYYCAYDFRVDEDAVKSLFNRIEKMMLPQNIEKVSDLIKAYNIGKNNIAEAEIRIIDVYDTNLRLSAEPEIAVGFMKKCASAERVNPLGEGKSYGYIEFYAKDTDAHIKFFLLSNGLNVVVNNENIYFRADTKELVRYLIDASGKQYGFTPPKYYSTLAEYFSDKEKYFSSISLISYNNGKKETSDKNKLDKIKGIITDNAGEAVYTPENTRDLSKKNIVIYFDNNITRTFVYENDLLYTLGNYFKMPDGFYDKVYAVINGEENLIFADE